MVRDHSIGSLNRQELSNHRVDVLAPWEHDQRPVRVNVVLAKRRHVDQVNTMLLRREYALRSRNPSSHGEDLVLCGTLAQGAVNPLSTTTSQIKLTQQQSGYQASSSTLHPTPPTLYFSVAHVGQAISGGGHVSPQSEGHWCPQESFLEQRRLQRARSHGAPADEPQAEMCSLSDS